MNFVFYLLAAVLVFLSYKSFRGGLNYLRYFRRELAEPKPASAPFAAVIAPCRGIDAGLEENLSALFRQDFPAYEVIFVVDDAGDEATEVIRKVIAAEPSPRAVAAKLIVAGKAGGESQKVHNLREAVGHVAPHAEIFVFVDSDARPGPDWLRSLVAPLKNQEIGATTAYRWIISRKRNLASEMCSVWNASVASALGENTKNNFCWGGSTAIRRKTFESLDVRRRWRGTLSDDFVLTRVLKEAGLAISFVPPALTASVEDCTWRQLLEFTTRQMKITRVYAPHLWRQSFIGAGLFNIVFVWGLGILAVRRPDGDFSTQFPFWYALAALLLISVFSTAKSWLRLKAVRLALRDFENDLRKQVWTQNTLWLFAPALFFWNDLAAWLSRRIVWRGIGYELRSAKETLIIEKSKV